MMHMERNNTKVTMWMGNEEITYEIPADRSMMCFSPDFDELKKGHTVDVENGWYLTRKGKRVKKFFDRPIGYDGPRVWMPNYQDLAMMEARRWRFREIFTRTVENPYMQAFDNLVNTMVKKGLEEICFIDKDNPEIFWEVHCSTYNYDQHGLSVQHQEIQWWKPTDGDFIDDEEIMAATYEYDHRNQRSYSKRKHLGWFEQMFQVLLDKTFKDNMRSIGESTNKPVVLDLELNGRKYIVGYGFDQKYTLSILHYPENLTNYIRSSMNMEESKCN